MEYFYLYQITNLVNGKIYVGVHKTHNLNDEYMGSGKIIKRAIEKYGIDNFRKDILEFFENAELMYAKEKEVVTEDFLAREDVYNLRRGGNGGFDYINKNGLYGTSNVEVAKAGRIAADLALFEKYGDNWRSIICKLGGNSPKQKLRLTPEYKLRMKSHLEKVRPKRWSDASRTRRLDSYTKNKHQQGEKNSQYGTMWITNVDTNESKKIYKGDPIPEGWIKGRTLSKRASLV